MPGETKRKPVIVHPALHIEDEDSSCSDGEANMHTTGPLKSSMTTDTDESLAMSGQDGSSDYEDQDWHRESQAPAGEWRAEESTFAARSTSGRSHTAPDGEKRSIIPLPPAPYPKFSSGIYEGLDYLQMAEDHPHYYFWARAQQRPSEQLLHYMRWTEGRRARFTAKDGSCAG